MPKLSTVPQPILEEDRQSAQDEAAHIRDQLDLLATSKGQLSEEYESLSLRVPALTTAAFANGDTGEARGELREINGRLRVIEAEQFSIDRAEAELKARLAEVDAESERMRVALLQAEDSRLQESEEVLIYKWQAVADDLGGVLKNIGDIEAQRAELAREIDGSSGPRWTDTARGLSYHLLWRVGRKSGMRRCLELTEASDPTGAWIAGQMMTNEERLKARANGNGRNGGNHDDTAE